MDLPTAIVLSSFLLGVVLLYGFTKDRWPWRRIMLFAVGTVILLIGLGVAGLWWMNRSEAEQREEREARTRKLHSVNIGDRYARVIQRQGVPDTTIVRDSGTVITGYWDSGTGSQNIEKVFAFTADSVLTNIRFIGDRFTSIEYGWVPLDRVVLGTSRDSVVQRLGRPCDEEVGERNTRLAFPTQQPDVLRYVRISHGEGRVVWHGWRRGQCDD